MNLGYEDGADSEDLAPAKRKFRAVCHEARKEKLYQERYDREEIQDSAFKAR